MLQNEWRKLPESEKMILNQKKKVSTNQLSNNWALGIIVSESSKEKLKTTLMQNYGTRQTRCIIDVQLGKFLGHLTFLA